MRKLDIDDYRRRLREMKRVRETEIAQHRECRRDLAHNKVLVVHLTEENEKLKARIKELEARTSETAETQGA